MKTSVKILTAFGAASLSDAWHIEDLGHFENAFRAALLKIAEEP